MKRKNNILTYKQATNIVENSNGVFTESKHLSWWIQCFCF